MSNTIKRNSVGLILFVLSFGFPVFASGAIVTVSGPQTICPGTPVTYHASATLLGLSQNGCFEWDIYENGQWTQVIGLVCPCTGISASEDFTYTWQYTGANQVRVRFIASLQVGCGYAAVVLPVTVKVAVPGIPTDSDGALVFCSTNQTKTITIPGIPFLDSATCYFHHKYDYIVPSGWTVVPSGQIPYTLIAGGIRTSTKSVNITTPGTVLPGFTGNYVITVKTEPAWPWLATSSKQVWIGGPTNTGSINGPSNANEGSVYTFSISGGKGATTYAWTWPSGWAAPATTTTGSALVTPWTNSGNVTVTPTNSCGSSQTSSKYVTVGTCQNCRTMVSPNPTSGSISIGMSEGSRDKTATHYEIYDSFGLLILRREFTEAKSEVDMTSHQKGTYLVKIRMSDGNWEQHRIIVKD